MASTTWRRLAGTSDIIVGADVRQITATNTEVCTHRRHHPRDDDTPGFERSGGVFAQLRVPIGDRITLVGGARGDSWQRERGGHSVGEVLPTGSRLGRGCLRGSSPVARLTAPSARQR